MADVNNNISHFGILPLRVFESDAPRTVRQSATATPAALSTVRNFKEAQWAAKPQRWQHNKCKQ